MNNIFLEIEFFPRWSSKCLVTRLVMSNISSKKDSGSWRIQQNPMSGTLKLSAIFNMNLGKFFKLLLSQMQGIVGFSESHRLNRKYLSVSIVLHCSANNAFQFLLKWLLSEVLQCASARLIMLIIFIIIVTDVVCTWRGRILNFWFFRFL